MRKLNLFFVVLFSLCVNSVTARNFFCVTAEEDNVVIFWKNCDVQISFDGENWEQKEKSDFVELAEAGDKVFFKGYNPGGILQSETLYYSKSPRFQFRSCLNFSKIFC